MTGRAPDKTRVWNFINDFRQGGSADGVPGEEWVTMPEFFVKHNYTTLGHGKLYHVSRVAVDLREGGVIPPVELTTCASLTASPMPAWSPSKLRRTA